MASESLLGSPRAPDPPKPAVVIKDLQLQSNVVQQELMHERSSAEISAQLVRHFKKQLYDAAAAVERKAENQQSRLEFLNRAIRNAEREKERLVAKLRQLDREMEAEEANHEQQMETLQYQSRDVKNQIAARVQNILAELRTLRQFQEQRQKLAERMAEVGGIIARERRDRTAELTAMHRKLVAQREYYEHQLTNKLSEADEFATKFEYLDLDRVTTKIVQETEQRREAMKAESALTTEVVKRNDQLRHQAQDLEQQRRILEESEKSLTTQAVDLKTKLQETAVKSREAQEQSRQRLDQLRKYLTGQISELAGRVSAGKKQTETLKSELALAAKQLAAAEVQCDDRLKKDQNLLGVMDEAAIFILTSLELQEKGPSKEEVAGQASALNAVIRKIGNVSQDMTGIRPSDEPAQQTLATREIPRRWVSSRKAANTAKPMKERQPGKQNYDFRQNPEHQRVFGKDAAPPPKAKVLRLTRANKQ
jgi:chromosome segregation ATPase